MTLVKKPALFEQRQALRQQLLLQRQSIARQLDSKSQASGYPRSMTMRFLSGKSAPGAAIFRNVAALLGIGIVKSVATSWFKARFAARSPD